MCIILRAEKFSMPVFIGFYLITLSLFAQSESTVLELHRQKFEWIINKNYEALTNVLADDVEYIHSNGWIQNKKEIIEDLQSGKLALEEIQVKTAIARRYKNAIIITGKGMFKGQVNGTDFHTMLLYTEVYSKHGKKWRLVQRHACKMPD